MDISKEEIEAVKNLPDKDFIENLKRKYNKNKGKIDENKILFGNKIKEE